jgi:hypothetical protein
MIEVKELFVELGDFRLDNIAERFDIHWREKRNHFTP